jgi:hypothetical protein
MAADVDLITNLTPADIERYVVAASQLSSDRSFSRWPPGRRDYVEQIQRWGVRVRVARDATMRLERNSPPPGFLTTNRCDLTYRLATEAERSHYGSAQATVVHAHFYFPRARAIALGTIGAIWISVGIGLTIGIWSDVRAAVAARLFFTAFGVAMAAVGVGSLLTYRRTFTSENDALTAWVARTTRSRPLP